jgi:hypothetical protein
VLLMGDRDEVLLKWAWKVLDTGMRYTELGREKSSSCLPRWTIRVNLVSGAPVSYCGLWDLIKTMIASFSHLYEERFHKSRDYRAFGPRDSLDSLSESTGEALYRL